MPQKNLFDFEPLQHGIYGNEIARKNDPVTSKRAAAEAAKTASGLHSQIATWLESQKEPLTAREIAEAVKRDLGLNQELETIRKRVSECVGIKTGRGMVSRFPLRRCHFTCKIAETFWFTETVDD